MVSPIKNKEDVSSQQDLQSSTNLRQATSRNSSSTSFSSTNGVDLNTLHHAIVGGWPLTSSSWASAPQHMMVSWPPTDILRLQSLLNPASLLVAATNTPAAQEPPDQNPLAQSQACSASISENDHGEEKKDQSVTMTIVPCRARGMPKDHNPKTAFFTIPSNIAHGEGLRCSHNGCQEKGVRFRFCSVCSVPVAKRNFSTRHHHGDLLEQKIREENGLVNIRSEADEDMAKRREVIAREKKGRVTSCSSSTSSVSSSSSLSSTSGGSEDDGDHHAVRRSMPLKKRRKLNQTTATDASAGGQDDASPSSDSREYHKQWMKLLARRPKQGESLDGWINEVMSLSEYMLSNPGLRAEVEDLHAATEASHP